MKLQERDLEFDFKGAVKVVKFDDAATHSTSSIKAVDFIVEFGDKYRFVEVKDPDEPGATHIEDFKNKLKSGELIRSLAGKYRDSLFFRLFQGNPQKDIEYIVLLSMKVLDDALILAKQDELQRSIPIHHKDWIKNSATACVILNLDRWKKSFGEDSICRMSDSKSK